MIQRTVLRSIRYEPYIAAVALCASMIPASDVALVRIFHAYRLLVKRYASRFCKMEYVFVALVYEPVSVERLEVPHIEITFRYGH
ncbi:MAG: hypothetical protein OXL96_18625 [Candidatus Poribacteria bacterium]|nr:hypothetical protein [Candidatus Poribacteria bacterium]